METKEEVKEVKKGVKEEEIRCSNCNRFVGAHPTCPYCGTKVGKRMSVTFFKYGALGVSFVGLILLYLAVRVIEVPIVKVEDITETMNFAYVRVVGTITRSSVYEGGALYLTVDDGTGDISVKAYGAVTEVLMRMENPPEVGDRIDVGGTLNMTESKKALLIQTADRVSIVPMEEWMGKLPLLNIGDITSSQIGEMALCQGRITAIHTFKQGRTYTISDGTGSIDIMVWNTQYEEIPNKEALQQDALISVQGIISSFKDKLQLKPTSPSMIKLVGAEAASLAPAVAVPAKPMEIATLAIGQITKDKTGQILGFRGTVTQYKPFAKGAMLVVSDDTGRIVVVLWDKVKDQITDDRIFTVGTKITVRGKLGVHREQLQLVPQRASDITIALKN